MKILEETQPSEIFAGKILNQITINDIFFPLELH